MTSSDPSLPDCVQDYLRARADSVPPFQPPPQVRDFLLLGMPEEEALRALSPRELLVQALRYHAAQRAAIPPGDGFPSRTAKIVIGHVVDGDRAFVLVEDIEYMGGYGAQDNDRVSTVPLTLQDGIWRVKAPAMFTGSGVWTQWPVGFD